MRRIVIATDGSGGGRAALEQGLELARVAGASAVVIYVRHAPLPIVGDPYYHRGVGAELVKGRATLDEAAARTAEAGVDAEFELLEGDPPGQVVELARARDADLVVVGSRGLGTMAGALLGSVSGEVVRKADRPVLVVTQRARARRIAA